MFEATPLSRDGIRSLSDSPASANERAFVWVEPADERRLVVLRGPWPPRFFTRCHEVEDVGRVVVGDTEGSVQDDRPKVSAREEPHRVAAQGDLDEALALGRALRDERASHQPRQLALDPRRVRVHVLDQELFVAAPESLEPLVLGRDVEEARVHVGRQPREVLLEPPPVVGAGALAALLEGHVERPKPRRLGALGRCAHEVAEGLHVG
jgi:hypothetical protein